MARESCHRVTDSNARAVVDTQSRWERLDQSHPTVIGLPLQCNDSVCSVTDRLSQTDLEAHSGSESRSLSAQSQTDLEAHSGSESRSAEPPRQSLSESQFKDPLPH